MATNLPDQTVGLNGSIVVENELQVSVAPISAYIRGRSFGPVSGDTVADAFDALVGANPFTPKVRLRYKATGSCDDFPAITIENGPARMLLPDRYNVSAWGVGVVVTFVVDVDGLSYSESPCQSEEEAGRRKVRTFAFDLSAEINVTPGVGGALLLEEFQQKVLVRECCPAEEAEGGGW